MKPMLPVIILAAGRSLRWGPENKLAHPIEGVPMLRRVVDAYVAAGCLRIVVVIQTGEEGRQVSGLLVGVKQVNTVENPQAAAGMGTSVRLGMEALCKSGEGAGGFMISPGDLPFVTAPSIKAVARAFERDRARRVVVPVYQGTHGHPVAFPGDWLGRSAEIPDDRGAGALLAAEGENVLRLELDDPGITRDCDRPS